MKRNVIGVRFQPVGKKYYFDPNGYTVQLSDRVVVETVRGIELGEVIQEVTTLVDDPIIDSIKPIIRIATVHDLTAFAENENGYDAILSQTQVFVTRHELNMRLLNAHYTLDREKLTVEYTSPERVDFRELVKDMARAFHARIELRQVGARDSAKQLGGIGPCGLILCCNTFLGEFENVSIKMAKNQNLTLNPVNISGLCGKLLCCLRYEDDMYTENRVGLPKEQSQVTSVDGVGTVLSNNILERRVRVYVENKGVHHYHVDELLDVKDTY